MLTKIQKKILEYEIELLIQSFPLGIDTRLVINSTFFKLRKIIPNINRHHISGMLSWVYTSYNHSFLLRTSGYSIIV